MEQKYLPIGSVCTLKGKNKKVMITGYYSVEFNGNLRIKDYCGCVYPEGMLLPEHSCTFNHTDIETIDFIGFKNDEQKTFQGLLNRLTGNNLSEEELIDLDAKTIEKLIPTPTKRKGLVATVQELGDILILNIYQHKKIQSRYCVNTKSGEYETFDCACGEWKFRKLLTAIGFDAFYSGAYRIDQELAFNSEEERKLAEEKVKEKGGKW